MTTPSSAPWPPLPLPAWNETRTTLHLWTQIVGKIRLANTPWLNHSWHVPLYLTARGLTTSLIPHGARSFSIDFDFIDHVLLIAATDGARKEIALQPRTVAAFYRMVMDALDEMSLSVQIQEMPNEIADAIIFSEDTAHEAYDREYAQRFWQVLIQVGRVFSRFRTSFIGKCSPVHFFWGSFDLAVTRFSGRRAPLHPGIVPNLPPSVLREAYSHEVSSAGFWPGGGGFDDPAFYSYAYPEPVDFRSARVEPASAFYSPQLGEFLLPYESVRTADDPEGELLAFLHATYKAAADCGRWDRAALECAPGMPGRPRPVD